MIPRLDCCMTLAVVLGTTYLNDFNFLGEFPETKCQSVLSYVTGRFSFSISQRERHCIGWYVVWSVRFLYDGDWWIWRRNGAGRWRSSGYHVVAEVRVGGRWWGRRRRCGALKIWKTIEVFSEKNCFLTWATKYSKNTEQYSVEFHIFIQESTLNVLPTLQNPTITQRCKFTPSLQRAQMGLGTMAGLTMTFRQAQRSPMGSRGASPPTSLQTVLLLVISVQSTAGNLAGLMIMGEQFSPPRHTSLPSPKPQLMQAPQACQQNPVQSNLGTHATLPGQRGTDKMVGWEICISFSRAK